MESDPIATFSHEHSVILPCLVPAGEEPCSIPLPLQSHLGTYEGLEYLPTNDWRETFLCLRHGRAFVCSPQNIHLAIQLRDPGQPVSSLWQVDAICAHERCGAVSTLYTAKMPDWHLIVQRILITSPKLSCSGHDFEWREDLITGSEIAHNSPVR